ncbi:hypothetical protein [Bradyrhizobium jicamae]|nr:hypothetical protein [Bradyrhizobium jicamae]
MLTLPLSSFAGLPLDGPGLGVDLLPAVFDRSDLTVRRSNT